MIRLTKEQVISIHSSLIEATDGTDGVRDEGGDKYVLVCFGYCEYNN